jgi:hypothetical protein
LVPLGDDHEEAGGRDLAGHAHARAGAGVIVLEVKVGSTAIRIRPKDLRPLISPPQST